MHNKLFTLPLTEVFNFLYFWVEFIYYIKELSGQ